MALRCGCNPHPPHPGAYAIWSQAPGVQVTTPLYYPRLPHVLNKTAYQTRRSIIGSDLTRLSLAQGASKHALRAVARKGPYQDY